MEEEKKTIGTFYYRMRDGGIERVISLLIPIWIDKGYNVVLFTEEEQNNDDYYVNYECVKRVTVCNNSVLSLRSYEERGIELRRLLVENSIDYFVYHSWMSEVLPQDMEVVKSLNIPFIVYTHGVFSTFYYDRDTNMELLISAILKADAIICLTEVSCHYFAALGGNVYYLQNPISPDLFSVDKAELAENNILWIGRIAREKNPVEAVRIFNLIKERIPSAKLYIVGDGDGQILEEMHAYCSSRDLEDSVFFEGYHTNPYQYYKRASIMLLTSEFEGYSMALLEAKAHGLPCVMYELPYLPLAQENSGVIAVERKDAEAAAEECIGLLEDRNYRSTVGESARIAFEKNYEYNLANEWDTVFEDLSRGIHGTSYKLDKAEIQMMRLLFEHNERGIRNTIQRVKESREYRLGNGIYCCLRGVKKILKKILMKE